MRKDHPFLHPGCQEDVACSYPALTPVASPPSRYSRLVIAPPPPPPPSLPLPPPVSDHNVVFSKSVMAMVALISTALLVVSLFITSVRCYQRRNPIRRAMQRRQTPLPAMDQFLEVEEPISPSWYINTVGLDASLINSITSSKFKSGEGLVEETGCSVCLSEFEDGDDLRLLPKCSHAFHLRCIDRWLGAHANCPLCRAPIFANNLNSVSGENIATEAPSTDASYDLESADGRESNGEHSRNSESTAVEIGEPGRENETVIANLNVLRVLGGQSSGGEQNGMTVAETTAFQPVRRSVSLSSLARIHARVDLPCGSMREAGSTDCENVNLGVFSRFREVGREPCPQKSPSGLRRSSSIGTNFFFSKHGRNRRSVLPL